MVLMSRVMSMIALTVTLVGCGNLQGMKIASPPSGVAGRVVALAAEPPAKEAIAPRGHALEKQGLYVLQTGGGSAVTGLLFGPLGVMANQANIASRTQELGESANRSDLLQIVPRDEALAAWKGLPALPSVSAADVGALTVAPYLMLYLDDDRKNLFTVVGLRVMAAAKGDAQAWSGNYNYALERSLPVERLGPNSPVTELEAYRNEIQEGYRQLRGEVLADLDPKRDAGKPAAVASIRAPILKSTLMGFAGFTSGDVEVASSGRLVMRVNMENYGPAMDRSVPYFLWIFPSAKQYAFDIGPELRSAQR